MVKLFASGFYYDETGGYFTDKDGSKVDACKCCILAAAGEVIASYQRAQSERVDHEMA